MDNKNHFSPSSFILWDDINISHFNYWEWLYIKMGRGMISGSTLPTAPCLTNTRADTWMNIYLRLHKKLHQNKKITQPTYYVITDEVRGRGYRWIKWTLNMSSYMPASEYNQDYDKYCVSARIDVHFPIPFTHNQHAGNRQVFYEDQNRISTLSSWPWPRSRCQFKP